jgi:hypothetical protein
MEGTIKEITPGNLLKNKQIKVRKVRLGWKTYKE